MYGLLHKALTSWISSLPDGDELLGMIMGEINFSGQPDDFFRFYSDEQTQIFLSAVSKVTSRTVEDCKFEAGAFFLTGILESGYGHSLRTLGDDFYTLLCNLDSLHESFLPSFPKMRAPSIRPQRNADGSLAIHYYSENKGLAMFMLGALKACALKLYDLDIDIHHRVKKGAGSNHDVFHVFMDERGYGKPKSTADLDDMCMVNLPTSLTNELFPWHFAFDRDLTVVSVGRHLASRLKETPIGKKLKKIFQIARPVDVEFSFDSLASLEGASTLFVIAAKHLKEVELANAQDSAGDPNNGMPSLTMTGNCPFSDHSVMSSTLSSKRASGDLMILSSRLSTKVENIKLHGQLTYHPDADIVMFLGVPSLRSLEDMESQGIALAELPLHSHGRELLYGSMFQSASAKNSVEVDARLASLDQSMAEVQEKKKQIDTLLHSILPPVVAQSLAQGNIPPAERYEHVSVLFSDIAGFTNISSEVPASEVMEMLHELFVRFDALADKHGCYKVETIGDAYMVAAGCPEECEDHATRIARLAIDMVHTAQTVKSPLDGEPLRIRIGLHSGPLMAGVVGRARPRYCLFGDTVNVASRMESNGLPGCIQVSYRFTQALPPDHPFEIVARGHIDIKGKGALKTYIILGSHEDENDQPLLPADTSVEDLAPHLSRITARMHSIDERLAEVNLSTSVLGKKNRKKSHFV